MRWKQHISVDPDVLVGKPIITGTRLSVELILDRLADGWTQEDLLRSYPKLTPQAIQAVFAFASEMMRDEEYSGPGIAWITPIQDVVRGEKPRPH